MQTSNIDRLHAQTGAEKADKPHYSELVERHTIDDIFAIIGTPESGYFAAMGQIRLTERQSFNECKKQIEQRDWKLLIAVMSAVAIVNQTMPDKMKLEEVAEQYEIKKEVKEK